jgi:hypothetical protein
MPTWHVQIDNEIKCSKLFGPSFDTNPLTRMGHLVTTSHILVTSFLEYVKLAKLAMV